MAKVVWAALAERFGLFQILSPFMGLLKDFRRTYNAMFELCYITLCVIALNLQKKDQFPKIAISSHQLASVGRNAHNHIYWHKWSKSQKVKWDHVKQHIITQRAPVGIHSFWTALGESVFKGSNTSLYWITLLLDYILVRMSTHHRAGDSITLSYMKPNYILLDYITK